MTALPEVLEKLERATPGPWYWTTNRDSIQSYVDGKNEVILWPANALSGDNLDWDHREKDGPFEGYPEWYARLGACGHRSEKDAAANAEAIIAAVNFLREHGPALLRDAGDGWLPIESAPSEVPADDAVLVCVTYDEPRFASQRIVGEAYKIDGIWWWAGTHPDQYVTDPIEDSYGIDCVTHWRPLPQPPAMHAPGGAGGGS